MFSKLESDVKKLELDIKQKLREELTTEKLSPTSIDRIMVSIFGSSGRAAGSSGGVSSSLPLLVKKDIAAQEAKILKHLQTIQKHLGLPVEVTLVPDFDWEGMMTSLKDNQTFDNKTGQVWEKSLGYLSKNIEKLAKDEMSREAVVSLWTTGQIRLIFCPDAREKLNWKSSPSPKSWDERFVDGVLEITCIKPTLAEDQIGKWIESHL